MTAPGQRDLVARLHGWTPRILQLAAVLTLIGLGLMVWSMAEPTPMPVILAMSVGQGVGILAFSLFAGAVLVDQLHQQRARGAENVLAPAATGAPRPAGGASGAAPPGGAGGETPPAGAGGDPRPSREAAP